MFNGFDAIGSRQVPSLRSISFRQNAIPTTDLYFFNCWCRFSRLNVEPPELTRLGANSFSTADHFIVCRRDSDAVIDSVLAERGRKLIYVIDDDLFAAESDLSLPDGYRSRITAFKNAQHARLIERADIVITSSASIAARYSNDVMTMILDPYWSQPLPSTRHFARLDRSNSRRIGYLGTESHSVDRAFVFKVFETLLDKDPRIRVAMADGRDIPDHLRAHPRFRIIRRRSWSFYRQALPGYNCHLLLYPILETPFNMGRSRNKIFEHAVAGGVGVYSRGWAYGDDAAAANAGLSITNDVESWVAGISAILNEREKMISMRRAAVQYVRTANTGSLQYSVWSRLLNS